MKKNDKNDYPKINENKSKSKSKIKIKHEYKNIFLCPLNKNDCVNSIDIFDDIILYGTIMGNVYLCRVNQNNLYQDINPDIYKSNNINNNNPVELNNSKNTNKNETQYDINIKYKIEEKDTSKISCIKLNTNNNINNSNNNNQFNGNETLRTNNEDNKEKVYFISDALPTTKTGKKNLNQNGVNTKQKLLNLIENNFNKSDKSSFEYDSTNKKNINEIDPIPFPQVTQLILNATENVPCVSFDTKDKVNISIGDYEIIRLENMSSFNINDDNSNYNYTRIRNYASENEHIKNCENATCMMTDKYFLLLHTIFAENNCPIAFNKINYQNKMMSSLDIIKGEIEMYNYSTPFDFDGDRFLFVDYESDTIRRICIYYTLTKKEPFIYKISNGFGHISYMKFLLNDKIILCKNQKICEIYKIDENFRLLESWEHIGNEIIAMNIYIEGTKDTKSFLDNSYTNLYFNKKYNENESQTIEINYQKEKYMKNKNKNQHLDNIYIMSPKNVNPKRKTYKKEKYNSSSLRELNNDKLLNKNMKIQYEMNNKYFSPNFNSEINNRLNKFEKEEDDVAIYSKYKTPSINKNKSINEYKKKRIGKLIDENSNNNYNNYTHLSDKELIKRNGSFQNIIQEKNKITERSLYQNEKKVYIITVDVNGNFNLYHNNRIKTIFNLYNISNIDKTYKEGEFFSMGFPYYVAMNSKYYAISTDHGIFVLCNNI